MTSPIEPGNVGGPTQPAPASSSSVSTPKDERYWNTLSRSEQKDVIEAIKALNMSMFLNIPILIPPSSSDGDFRNITIEGIVSSVRTKFAEIGAKMWDDYLKNLQIISQQIADRVKSPEYQEKLEETNPLSIKNVINSDRLIAGVTDYINNHKNDKDALPFMAVASFSVMAISLLAGQGIVPGTAAVVDVVSSPMVHTKPIVDSAQISQAVLPPNLADASAMVINLFLPSMMFASALGAAPAEGKSDKQLDLEFARKYASNILAKVNSNEINQFLSAMIVHQFEEGEPISREQLAQTTNITKLVMLAVAFALFYKVETKWLTGQEFADFIKNNPYKQGDVEYSLIETIKKYLGLISAGDRAAVLEGIMAYCDRNPALEELLNPEKAFSHIIRGFQREVDAA